MNSISNPFFLLCLLFFHTHFPISSGISISTRNMLKSNEFDPMVKRSCDSKIGEYLEEETMMDSESNRRVLMMQKKYISYETLKRDLVPCGTPGASYYNCNGKGVAGPYNRGCEVITRCARDAMNT